MPPEGATPVACPFCGVTVWYTFSGQNPIGQAYARDRHALSCSAMKELKEELETLDEEK